MPSLRQMICQINHVVAIKMWETNSGQNIQCCIANELKSPFPFIEEHDRTLSISTHSQFVRMIELFWKDYLKRITSRTELQQSDRDLRHCE